ncbi:MAG: DUF2621 family protein [bacterium]
MNWSLRALDLLDLLVKDIPEAYRERQKRHAVEEVENYCRETRIREVGYDQVVVGYIRATPAHQRQGLRQVMKVKGVPVEKYEGHFMAP